LPTDILGGIVSAIEITLTHFKNDEAICLMNEIALPSIFLSSVK
jgi:hypothetical protein